MLFLHIGTHKTGTSALQTFMTRRSDVLLEKGAHYIQAGLGEGIAHHALSFAIRGRPGSDMAVWDAVRAEIAASECPIQVLSTEAFWFTEPAKVKEALGGAGDVRLVVYLRRQDKYLQSLYKQAVTSGRKADFATWRAQYGFRGDYFSVLRQWADAFGADSIVVRPYERDGARVDVTEDFFHVLGIDVADELKRRKQRVHNPSPRRELLELFRALNQLGLDYKHDKLFWSVIGRSNAYIRSADILDTGQCAALMKDYDEGNRALAGQFYRDASTPLFPALAPVPPVEVWGTGSTEYFKMTVDFLDALSETALSGEMKLKPAAQKKKNAAKAALEAE